jgi:hypothetical protein
MGGYIGLPVTESIKELAGVYFRDSVTDNVLNFMAPREGGMALGGGGAFEAMLRTDNLESDIEVDLNLVAQNITGGQYVDGGADVMNFTIINKGDGDTIEHAEGITGLMVLGLFDQDEDYGFNPSFYVEAGTATPTTFVLKNDLEKKKFHGIMAVIRPGGNSLYVLTIANKGDGDTVTHHKGVKLRIICLFDSDNEGRRYDGFKIEEGTDTDIAFVLKNDFETTKFNGVLICVPYL